MKIYITTLILLLTCHFALAKNIGSMTFRDFPIIQNLDSLEEAVNNQNQNPEKYLIELLTLEKSREMIKSYKFGNYLPTIDSLLKIRPFTNIKATYLYFLGINVNLKEESSKEALQYTTTALGLFEKLNDTSGIVNCLNRMVQLNISHYGNANGDLAIAERYLNRLVFLADHSNCMDDQLTALYAKQFFYYARVAVPEPKPADLTASKEVSLKAISLINQFPQYIYWKHKFLNFYANLFFCEKKYQKSAEFHLQCLKLITSNESNYNSIYNYNLGNDYINLQEFQKAENCFLDAIAKRQSIKSSLSEEMNILDNLSEVQFSLKEYNSAWKNIKRLVSIKDTLNNQSKTKAFLELQTKYETDKKEQANQVLQKQKRQYQLAILFGILLVATISILLFYLSRKNKQLDENAHFRDQIFTIISHDLRSPVIALEGLSKQASFLVRKGKINDLELVSQQIDNSVAQMNSLLNNLLAWAISQNTNANTKTEPILLLPLVQEIVTLYTGAASFKQVAIAVNIPDNLMVHANKNGVAVILRNLIDNAIKHATSKKITISGVLEVNQLVLQVINNDFIESMETIEKIRNQLKGTSTNNMQAASGFGLNLIAYFSKLHKGTVEIKSDRVNGTVFTVYLPQ